MVVKEHVLPFVLLFYLLLASLLLTSTLNTIGIADSDYLFVPASEYSLSGCVASRVIRFLDPFFFADAIPPHIFPGVVAG